MRNEENGNLSDKDVIRTENNDHVDSNAEKKMNEKSKDSEDK